MKIKEVLPINFIFQRKELTMKDLITMIPVSQQLLKEAVGLGIPILGAVHWHYANFTGEMEKPFTLDVCVPVGSIPKDYDGSFHFKRTDKSRVVSAIHEGSWMDLPKVYGEIYEFIEKHKLQPNGDNREIYINCDFENPMGNSTEVQIGIAKMTGLV